MVHLISICMQWPEQRSKIGRRLQVVRRLFLLVGTSAFVASGEGSGGLDIALGPNVGCSPLGLLGPAAILQGLLAGPSTEDPRKMPAALPLVGYCTPLLPASLAVSKDPRMSLHHHRSCEGYLQIVHDQAPHPGQSTPAAYVP